MKNRTIHIRLSVIIPLIIAGLALLAAIGSFHIGRLSMQAGGQDGSGALLWYTAMTAVAFVIGILVTRPLLTLARRLVVRTEQYESCGREDSNQPASTRTSHSPDEMARFANAVNQVTDILDQLQAARLFPDVVGHSQKLLSVLSLTHKIAGSDASVLLLGESGTGKELLARSLHEQSSRCNRPFVVVNCAAIPASLLESELFGHEKGAYTGASSRRIGTIEAAAGGTLFLDEIGDMPLETQAKILRAIEQREVQRVGGNGRIPVDVRIVAATNKDLAALVERGQFRQDLYFRINVFSLIIPPLRERREDIPLLADAFLRQFGNSLEISSEALAKLTAYHWPGNVRELRNAIKTASVLADNVILSEHLPPGVTQAAPTVLDDSPKTNSRRKDCGLKERMEGIERAIIIEALSRTGGVQVRAAELLGISQRSLWHRVGKLDIDVQAIKKNLG